MADAKITALTLDASPATSDLLLTVDVSDTSMGADGTDKKVTVGTLPFAATSHTHTVSQVGTGTPAAGKYLDGAGAWTTLPAAGSGTVTTASVASANGFGGSVATATTTPAITITTSVTGLLKGNGTGVSAAVSGTDFAAASHTHSAADVTSGTLGVARGGTGLATIASGKLLYASASNTLAALTLGTGLSITSGTLDATGGGGGTDTHRTVATEHGCVGDGSTDNTTAINALLAAAAAASLDDKARSIYFPPGTYLITDGLQIQGGQIYLYGESVYSTVILQTTANKPIFYVTSGYDGALHHGAIKHMRLLFTAVAGATDTKQIAFMNAPANGTPSPTIAGTGSGEAYLWEFEDLVIENSFVGIGVYSVSGSATYTRCTVRNIYFRDTKFSALDLWPATPSGQPMNRIENVDIVQFDLQGDTTGPAIRGAALAGFAAENINIEDWKTFDGAGYGNLMRFSGCDQVRLTNIRTERIRTTGGNPNVIQMDGVGTISIESSTFSLSTQETGNATCVAVTGGAIGSIRNCSAARNTDQGLATTSNTIQLGASDTASGSSLIGEQNVLYTGVVPALASTSAFGNGIYGWKRYDGLPAIVDVLPTAAAAWRGREFTVLGNGTSTADVTSRCILQAAGTYAWVAI